MNADLKNNIYWPVYKSLESEVERLMYSIHIDDSQLDVYSSKISDLILRACTEIESISKDLYQINGGTKDRKKIKYDYDALKLLDKELLLKRKKVIISHSNYHATLKVLYPFQLNEKRTGTDKCTYGWNNAYQNLKHDRSQSLTFGSVKYLFSSLSALFILNVYLKNITLSIQGEKSINSTSLGSVLFNIEIGQAIKSEGGIPFLDESTIECVLIKKLTDKSAYFYQDVNQNVMKKIWESIFNKNKNLLTPINQKEFFALNEMEDSVDFFLKNIPQKTAKTISQEAYLLVLDEAKDNEEYEIVINSQK